MSDHGPRHPLPGANPRPFGYSGYMEAMARLVGGAMARLWAQSWDPQRGGCCPRCCGECYALSMLTDRGMLDDLYGIYVGLTGADEMWDERNRRVDRAFLARVWSVNLGCHEPGDVDG